MRPSALLRHPRSRTGVARRRSALPGHLRRRLLNELRTEIHGHVSANESLVNAPNWLPLTFAAEDGPWLGEEAVGRCSDFQELDLRRGVLTRRRGSVTASAMSPASQIAGSCIWEPPISGSEEMKIIPENWSAACCASAQNSTARSRRRQPRYRGLACRHLDLQAAWGRHMVLVVETNQSHIRVAEAARAPGVPDGAHLPGSDSVTERPGRRMPSSRSPSRRGSRWPRRRWLSPRPRPGRPRGGCRGGRVAGRC